MLMSSLLAGNCLILPVLLSSSRKQKKKTKGWGKWTSLCASSVRLLEVNSSPPNIIYMFECVYTCICMHITDVHMLCIPSWGGSALQRLTVRRQRCCLPLVPINVRYDLLQMQNSSRSFRMAHAVQTSSSLGTSFPSHTPALGRASRDKKLLCNHMTVPFSDKLFG